MNLRPWKKPQPRVVVSFVEAAFGPTTCMAYKADRATVCGAPGRWHVLWSVKSAAASVLCHMHFNEDVIKLPMADHHELGGLCNIPGASWVKADPDNPSRCDFPHGRDHLETAVQVDQPQTAGAAA